MIHTYYLDLVELLGAIVALVLLKLVLLLAMTKMGAILSDDPEPVVQAPKQKLPRGLNLLRWALVGILTLSAVWQVRPHMLFVNAAQLIAAGSFAGVAHWWVANALWLNIWSIVIEFAFAGMLTTFSSPFTVRLTAAVLGVYSLFVWSVLQGFGHVLSQSPSLLTGVPGTGLLMACATLPLVFQRVEWRRVYAAILGAYWLLMCVIQVWPATGFWSGEGYRRLDLRQSAALPGPLSGMVHAVLATMAGSATVWTIGLAVVSLALAAGSFFLANHWALLASAVVATAIWVLIQGFGFTGGYALTSGTAPFMVLFSWLARRQAAEHSQVLETKQKHGMAV